MSVVSASEIRGRLVIQYGELAILSEQARTLEERRTFQLIDMAAEQVLAAFRELGRAQALGGSNDGNAIYLDGEPERV
jgi:hypothetical protein